MFISRNLNCIRHDSLSWVQAILFLGWVGLLALGMVMLAQYSNKPGALDNTVLKFPRNTNIQLSANKSTMLVFLHPYCSCSLATLENLERLQPSIKNKVEIYALFFSPSSQSADWSKTISWYKAARIPRVHVMKDTDGQIAKQFHAATSGYVVVYGIDGHKIFSGGITPSRGHSGESKGTEAITALLNTAVSKTKAVQTFVFGCSILNSLQGNGVKL